MNESICPSCVCAPGGGGVVRIWKGGDVGRKFWIKPLKETNHGVTQDFLTPKEHPKWDQSPKLHLLTRRRGSQPISRYANPPRVFVILLP